MKIGDKVVIREDADVVIEDFYARHGIITGKTYASDSEYAWLVVKFADGVVENYRSHELDLLTDKEWFQLQLRG